jgi:phosphoglycolate phosphatase
MCWTALNPANAAVIKTPMHRYELIVFDWDGTLMDSESRIVRCLQGAAADCGIAVPDDSHARRIIGLGLSEAMMVLFPDESATTHDRLVEAYRVHFLERDQTPSPLFPGVKEGLEALANRGYLMAVATGKSRRGLDRVLDETGTRHHFVATRCADEAFSKPHPKMLLDILDMTGARAEAALMVGDTVYDMALARNARVDALAVCYGVHERDELLAHGPKACVHSFDEVCQWLA